MPSGTHYTVMQDSLDGRLFAIPQCSEAMHVMNEGGVSRDISGGSHDDRVPCCHCVSSPSWEVRESSLGEDLGRVVIHGSGHMVKQDETGKVGETSYSIKSKMEC